MNLRSTTLALLCGAGLTACHGASTYTPQPGDSSQATLERAPLAAAQACAAKPAAVPGKYIGLFASGTVSGGTFTSVFGQWSLLAYSKSAAPDSSAATPAPKPAASPTWLYTGTYTMTKTKKKGCVLLVVGQDVKPLASGASSNGVVTGAPLVTAKGYSVTVAELGVLSMKLTGLNGAGGRGTATLITQALKPYDTATIVLDKRTSVNSASF